MYTMGIFKSVVLQPRYLSLSSLSCKKGGLIVATSNQETKIWV